MIRTQFTNRWMMLFLGALLCSVPQDLQAQTTTAQPVSARSRIVGFRATEWKTIHSHSEEHAQQTIATLKKLGCEVKTENHGDHMDIQFQCSQWKSMKLKTDSLVNQWSAWCDTQGMETVVVNPPANTKRPTVQFRMPKARTVHLHDMDKAKQIITTLTLVGCKVETAPHDGHLDTTFSCPEWTTIELVSEDSAHAWQKWLNESGFETKHTHVN